MSLFLAILSIIPTPALVRELGANDWHVREAAPRELARRGDAAWSALHAALRSPDPEIAWRATEALRPVYEARWQRSLAIVDRRWPGEAMPFLDSFYYDPVARSYCRDTWTARALGFYLDWGHADCDHFHGFAFPAERAATRFWLASWVMAGAPACAFDPLLAGLRKRDAVYLRGCGR